MKVIVVFGLLFALLFLSLELATAVWISISPIVDNFVSRPFLNPFFGSYRIVGSTAQYGQSGFSIRELFSFSRISLVAISTALVLRRRKSYAHSEKLELPFLFFILALVLSSIYSHSVIHRIRVVFDTYLLCYCAYFIGKNIDLFSKDNTILKAIAFLGTSLAVVAIVEFSKFSISNPLYRVTGPFLYWENLALTIAICILAVQYLVDSSLNMPQVERRLMKLAQLVMFIGVLLAQTRTIIVTLVVSLVVYSFIGRDIVGKKRYRRLLILVAALVVLVFVFPSIIATSDIYQQRIMARTDESRAESYLAAVRMFAANPIFGIGLKDFTQDSKFYLSSSEAKWGLEGGYCHNSYLVVAAEAGLLGLFPMFLLVYGIVSETRGLLIASRKCMSRADTLWSSMMIGVTMMYLLSALTFDVFFEDTIDNKLFFLLIGISMAKKSKLHDRISA